MNFAKDDETVSMYRCMNEKCNHYKEYFMNSGNCPVCKKPMNCIPVLGKIFNESYLKGEIKSN